ncbi:TIGR04104 family putative zinc finger protein [Ornithinibacillus scapharcae]|uniref:TIGR04104 family putative zinc finger protein n=1 Tax=Ornithinibacillus scapharcae TaxID=1147159 RepID=UPI000225BAA1|nr:TIGR04104 family putative zinc finger protein [Ornithinibacillus scapharcae]
MPTCTTCHTKWSWKQTFKKSFTLDTGMTCPHCGEKQYLTSKSRKRNSFTVFIIPLILLVSLVFDISVVLRIVLIFSAAIVMFVTYPFFIELSEKEEPLW